MVSAEIYLQENIHERDTIVKIQTKFVTTKRICKIFYVKKLKSRLVNANTKKIAFYGR